MSMKTIAILIISSEIVEKVADNRISKYIVNELNSLSYNITKLILLSENTNLICHEIESLIQQFDIVIVIGGIKNGIVYKAIEKAFSQELQYNSQLVQILNEIKEPYDIDEISIPIPARLLKANDVYPVIYLQRIFVLKEDHLERTFEQILKKHLIRYRNEPAYKKKLEVQRNGNSVNFLHKASLISRNLNIEYSESDHFITFTATSTSQLQLIEFENKIREEFNSYSINSIEDTEIWGNISVDEDNDLIKLAIENIRKCIQQYGPTNIFVCFNGGKDCTVLLHLILAVFKKFYPKYQKKVLCLYVQSTNSFLEQDEFILQCQRYYDLEIITVKSGIKDALIQVLKKYQNYKACFMGTRRIDPFSSNLNVFQMTDADWPAIMRVSPLLDWHYSDIWDYLLYYKVPYCRLYDMGYTSLGNTVNTIKNPSLLYYDIVEEKEKYLPAYKLLKETKERHGRGNGV